MVKCYIHSIEYYLPGTVEYNSPDDKLTNKIGIYTRTIADQTEQASDLAVHAANKLFEQTDFDREEIDFVIFCTQSADYILPTTACIIQERLQLPRSCGAFDFNLGCSGYVYGLSIAKGLIESGSARNILLLTGDTYSKYINKQDRSVKVLFGDAASATLLSGIEHHEDIIGPFVFGTDGSGANNLIVPAGGHREPYTPDSFIEHEDEFGNIRSRTNLYMNGPEIFNFTLKEVPAAVQKLLEISKRDKLDYRAFVFHQANKYMLEHLRKKLEIEQYNFPIEMENCGNTVSSTIPIVIKNQLSKENIAANDLLMLVGFGVGYSWAACNLKWLTN